MNKKLIIVGGGASGLFAAFTAASGNKNLDITILDANDCAGKKILATGNGRCNLTNTDIDEKKYYCSDDSFVRGILEGYGSSDAIETFTRLGIALRNKNGYIYPESMQASAISAALISACRLSGVKLINHCYVTRITAITENGNTHFEIKTSQNETYSSDYLILAYGSNAGLATDYTSALNQCVKQLGHRLTPVIPALCSLYADKKAFGYSDFFKKTCGVRTDISVRLCEGTPIAVSTTDSKSTTKNFAEDFIKDSAKNLIEDSIVNSIGASIIDLASDSCQYICHNGELQITDYGLSGIVIFQISHTISRMLTKNNRKAENKRQDIVIHIDFLPKHTTAEVLAIFTEQYFYEKKTLSDLFSGILNAKLALGILNLYSCLCTDDIKPHMKNIPEDKLKRLISFMKNVPFKIIGTNEIKHAQVCAGGIDISDIRPDTLESRVIPNLYFCGECIDVDGICGGYNLQWAWSTGYIAGTSIAKEQTDD